MMKSLADDMLNKWLKNFMPSWLRIPDAVPGTLYYGTGETAHWAVQTNMNVLAAAAVAGRRNHDDALIQTALKMFRYALMTHKTGGMPATDGNTWGAHWISVLGMERMMHGVLALESCLTADDRARYRALRLYEAEFLLNEYPVVANMVGASGQNKPESNIWNGGFLCRCATDYPDAPHAAQYREKGVKFLLNGLSYETDAASEKLYDGKPLREWHTGFNFTPNWSLDHHGYMNIGYTMICFSNLAMLHFHYKERGIQPPEALYHHVRDCWMAVRNFFFPDGRLLRIGGDTRTRYTYCQCFALPALLFATDYLKDEEAKSLASGYLAILKKEQDGNPDGSFFGKRLDDVRQDSGYYYARLESDAALVLSCGLRWQEMFGLTLHPAAETRPPVEWHDEYHSAVMINTGSVIRSFAGLCGIDQTPNAFCLPDSDSSLAEWDGNLFTRYELHHGAHHLRTKEISANPDSFFCTGKAVRQEAGPHGEGELPYDVVETEYATAALPDGKTLIVMERSTVIKEVTLRNVMTINQMIPNDVFNDFRRTYTGKNFSYVSDGGIPENTVLIDTGCKKITVDKRLTIVAADGADSLKICRPAKRTGGHIYWVPDVHSIALDYLCGSLIPGGKTYPKGTILADTVTLAAVDAPDCFGEDAVVTKRPGKMPLVEVTGCDGIRYVCDPELRTISRKA